ncbi:protein kinase [Gaetbulibacter sp. M235]|uniref:protein kinase domain-containing protein n=1 Tax=Gaetbulibacter sp. M235 TaxID=3126510 RepID=UPI00374F27CA
MGRLIQNNITVNSTDGQSFRTIQFLGEGGNCQVYLAMATKGTLKGVLFAIKFFLKSNDEGRLLQFNKEKSLLIEVTHPAIMKIYCEGKYYSTILKDYVPFVVADYFPDRLDQRLSNNRLGLMEKLIYITQLLSALQHLDGRNPKIVHRDIKPENIFLKGYSCVLGDFGLMRDLDPKALDEDGNFMKQSDGPGMPKYYRTPDLVSYAKKEKSLTTKSDIFQLGLVAAKMFTGRNPLKRCNDKLDKVELEEIGNVPGISGELIKDIIRKMLVMNPEDRGDLEELLDSFDGVLKETANKHLDIDGFVL